MQPERFEVVLRIATGLLIYFQKREIPVLISAKFTDGNLLRIPSEAAYLSTLDQIAAAKIQFSPNLQEELENLADLKSCDRVFSVGSAP